MSKNDNADHSAGAECTETDPVWHLTLLSKPSCPLCAAAKQTIGEFAKTHPVQLKEVDVSAEDSLWEKYRYEIPVLLMEGREVARHYVSARKLQSLYLCAMTQGPAAAFLPAGRAAFA